MNCCGNAFFTNKHTPPSRPMYSSFLNKKLSWIDTTKFYIWELSHFYAKQVLALSIYWKQIFTGWVSLYVSYLSRWNNRSWIYYFQNVINNVAIWVIRIFKKIVNNNICGSWGVIHSHATICSFWTTIFLLLKTFVSSSARRCSKLISKSVIKNFFLSGISLGCRVYKLF